MAETFVPEAAERIKSAVLPEVLIDNLVLVVMLVTEDTAEITAEYDTDFPVPTHNKVRFILVKIDGDWLISAVVAEDVGGVDQTRLPIYAEAQDSPWVEDGPSPSRHVQICRADVMPRC